MSHFALQALGPLGATFVLALIALGVVAVLREGSGDVDRRSFSSDLASRLGIFGMIVIPLAAIGVVRSYMDSALLLGAVPAAAGIVAGLLAALIVLGRQALFPKH